MKERKEILVKTQKYDEGRKTKKNEGMNKFILTLEVK